MHTLKGFARACIGAILRRAPAGTADYVYIRLLRPRPIRAAANLLLRALIPTSVAIPEGVVRLNPSDPVVSGALALGVYEPYETSVYREQLKPGMTVVDIGANLGLHTVIAASRVGTGGRVISFEPEPENFSLLEHNVRANGFGNVTAINRAVADRVGRLTLNLSDSNKGRHSLVRTRFDSREFSRSVEVDAVTLDAELATLGCERVDVIKMDIEGAEVLALKGMQSTLAQSAISLFIEFSPSAIRRAGTDPATFLEDLRKRGFDLFELSERQSRTMPIADAREFAASVHDAMYTNLLCVKR
jgi:FkbM family methyltransferase